MKTTALFQDKSGNVITNIDLLKALEKIKANDCEVLYIHSSLSFGLPNPEIERTELLGNIYNVIMELKVPTICMPTYTFSFCNSKAFDCANSKSKMGALNEFFRVQDEVIRSCDPLMSVALFGSDKDLVTKIGNESIGANSNFDLLHHRKNVKFLFLGTQLGECFTYMHYLEWLFKVDYRYNRTFRGIVIEDGIKTEKKYILFVRYNGVTPNNGSFIYEQRMKKVGDAQYCSIGDTTVTIVEESIALNHYKAILQENPYFFVNMDSSFGKKDKTFILDNEMVAL